MEREELLKRLEEMRDPQLQYLAMINEAFLQSMDIINKMRELADHLAKTDYRGPTPVEHYIAREMYKIIDGEQ